MRAGRATTAARPVAPNRRFSERIIKTLTPVKMKDAESGMKSCRPRGVGEAASAFLHVEIEILSIMIGVAPS
jgi:hypothetical protein